MEPRARTSSTLSRRRYVAALGALLFVTTAGLGAGCSGPGGGGDGIKPPTAPQRDPRQSDFETPVGQSANGRSDGAPDAGVSAAADSGPAAPAADNGADPQRLIEEGDIYKLEGTTLFVLNRYRGLQVVDLADPAKPRMISQVPFYGQPLELYIRDNRAYVVVSDYWSWWRCDDCEGGAESFRGSKVYVVDVKELSAPSVLASLSIEGQITDSRIVGDVMYIVSNEFSWWYYDGSQDTRDNTYVASINLADPTNPRLVSRLDFPRNGWDNHINVTQSDIFIASPSYGYWDGTDECRSDIPCTQITHIDISDPQGAIRERAKRVVSGFIQDRWQLDFDASARVLRMVTADLGWWTGTAPKGPLVRTYQVQDGIRPLGRTEVVLKQPESTTAVRFAGDRAYVVTFERIDPLFTIDLSDPANPQVVGELETPGWLDYIEPRGDRLVALGHDQDPGSGTWSLQVSLYDVADLTQPKLLSRVPFGGDWGWTPGERDDFQKVFRVIDQLGLILVPFSSYESDGWWGRSYGNVQLIDFNQDTLTLRGRVRQNGYTERALTLGTTKLVALSSEVLDVLDIADRARPRLLGSLELARNVVQLAVRGDYAVEYVGDYYQGTSALYVVPASDPNAAEPLAKLSFPYPLSRIFRDGSLAYVVTEGGYAQGDSGEIQPPRLVVVDLSDPRNPVIRGKIDMPGMNCGGGYYDDYGCYGYYGYYGNENLVQVQGSLLVTKQDGGCREWDSSYYRCTRTEPTRLHVLDLSNPDQPRLASTVSISDVDWLSGLAVRGSMLYLSHYEGFDRNGYYWARYYLDRIDLSDPRDPVRLPKVNVPGQFVGASPDNQVIYTLENWWSSDESRTFLHALDLGPDSERAYLRDTLAFDGYLNNNIVFRGTRGYTTLSRIVDQNTWQSKEFMVAVDLSNPDALTKSEAAMPGQGYFWWESITVAGQRAFLKGGDGLAIFDLSDPARPAFQAFERTLGYGWYGTGVAVSGDTAYVPTGYGGVQMIQLEE